MPAAKRAKAAPKPPATVHPLAPPTGPSKERRVLDQAAVKERICDALKLGVTCEAAANYAGCSRDTYYRWRKDDPDFAAAADLAMSASEVQLIMDIRSDGSWQSKAWLLERRWPERYGRMERKPEATSDGGKKVVLTWGDDDPVDGAR